MKNSLYTTKVIITDIIALGEITFYIAFQTAFELNNSIRNARYYYLGLTQ